VQSAPSPTPPSAARRRPSAPGAAACAASRPAPLRAAVSAQAHRVSARARLGGSGGRTVSGSSSCTIPDLMKQRRSSSSPSRTRISPGRNVSTCGGATVLGYFHAYTFVIFIVILSVAEGVFAVDGYRAHARARAVGCRRQGAGQGKGPERAVAHAASPRARGVGDRTSQRSSRKRQKTPSCGAVARQPTVRGRSRGMGPRAQHSGPPRFRTRSHQRRHAPAGGARPCACRRRRSPSRRRARAAGETR